MSGTYDIIIIGGGHNGLTAAAWLARSGRKVLLLERRAQLGGLALGESYHQGYTSAGVLRDTTRVSPEVVSDLKLEDHGLKWAPNPGQFVANPDGDGFMLHGDPAKAAEEIAKFSQKDAEAWLEWKAFLNRIRPFMRKLLIDLPTDVDALKTGDLLDLARKGLALRRLGKKDMMEIMRVCVMCSADWLNEYFENDLLKAALSLSAVHGSFTGPWSPGNTTNLILAETNAGDAVLGGSSALIHALEKAAISYGAEIRTDATVSAINTKNNRISGVSLGDGSIIEASCVVATCHPQHALLDLVDNAELPHWFSRNVSLIRSRGTSALVNIGLKRPIRFSGAPETGFEFAFAGATHIDDVERAYDHTKYGRFSDKPVLSIHAIPQPESAPENGQSLSILAHFAPYHLKGGWSQEQNKALGEVVLDTLERYDPNIRAAIAGSEVLSPADMEARYSLPGGHIHHGEQALDQLLIRPAHGCADYRTPIGGLYLCGSGSRPGGELTGLPGLLGAKRVSKDGN